MFLPLATSSPPSDRRGPRRPPPSLPRLRLAPAKPAPERGNRHKRGAPLPPVGGSQGGRASIHADALALVHQPLAIPPQHLNVPLHHVADEDRAVVGRERDAL